MLKTMTALALVTAGALGEDGLDALRWQARPVIVFAEAGDRRLGEQLVRLADSAVGLADRRVIVIVDDGSRDALRTRFAPDGFTVILVGLDGGEKFRAGSVVDPATLDALIDAMPMRRRDGG